MKSNLIGRLKNTKLPYSHALLPLYEAIVNAIQAVEATPDWKDRGRIKVEIIREPTLRNKMFLTNLAYPLWRWIKI